VLDLCSVDEAPHPRDLGPLVTDDVSRHHFPMDDPRTKYAAREGVSDDELQVLVELLIE
jgi:hypothetical protein